MNNIQNASRRGFLKDAFAAGTFVLGVQLVPGSLWAKASTNSGDVFQPDMFLAIAVDGTVTILAHRSEMGCGSRTALPLVVADEIVTLAPVAVSFDGSDADDPSITLPKLTDGVTLNCPPPPASPVPKSGMTAPGPETMRLPPSTPLSCGLNVTFNVTLLPEASVSGSEGPLTVNPLPAI